MDQRLKYAFTRWSSSESFESCNQSVDQGSSHLPFNGGRVLFQTCPVVACRVQFLVRSWNESLGSSWAVRQRPQPALCHEGLSIGIWPHQNKQANNKKRDRETKMEVTVFNNLSLLSYLIH
jgi:hypothetical protein